MFSIESGLLAAFVLLAIQGRANSLLTWEISEWPITRSEEGAEERTRQVKAAQMKSCLSRCAVPFCIPTLEVL